VCFLLVAVNLIVSISVTKCLIICSEISLFLNNNMGFLLDDPLARSYLNVLMIGHCHLMLVILLIVLMLILVRHTIPLFIQNCVVSYLPMVFKVNC